VFFREKRHIFFCISRAREDLPVTAELLPDDDLANSADFVFPHCQCVEV